MKEQLLSSRKGIDGVVELPGQEEDLEVELVVCLDRQRIVTQAKLVPRQRA